LLGILLRILARMKEGISFKSSYCMKVPEYENKEKEDEVLKNRLKLRKYFKELDHFQALAKDQELAKDSAKSNDKDSD